MKTSITEIKIHPEGVEIKAIIFSRFLPPPNFKDGETDEQYAERVKAIAEDMNGFENLHIGRADLIQKPEVLKIPKVCEYD